MVKKQLKATPAHIARFIQKAGLGAQHYEEAMRLSGNYPDVAAWRRFLRHTLLVLGVGMTGAGIVCFFALNWQAMPAYAKFSLLEGAIVAAVLLAWWFELPSLRAKVSLLFASLLMGALLAVIAQVYQTGAGTASLFFYWALFILPWTLIARFVPLWFLFLALMEAAYVVFNQAEYGLVLWSDHNLVWTLSGFNFLVVAGFETGRRLCWSWLRGADWMIATIHGLSVSLLGSTIVLYFLNMPVPGVFTASSGEGVTLLVVFGGILVVSSWYYSAVRLNIAIITVSALNALAVGTVLCMRFLFHYVELNRLADDLAMLLLGLAVVAQVSVAAGWLLRAAKRVPV